MLTDHRPTVLISQLFFTHYRASVMKRLLASDKFHFLLCGAEFDVSKSGIEPWIPEDKSRFIAMTTERFGNHCYAQWGLIRLALRSDLQVLIYTGDPQHLTTWISAATARFTGKKVLFWTHGWLKQESSLKEEVRCVFYRLANGLLLYGERARQIGIQKGFKPSQLHVIFNSLDYPKQAFLRSKMTAARITDTRRSLFESPENPLIICVARLIQKRKLELLFSAMVILRTQERQVNLLLVGDGPDRSKLECLARHFELPVKFVGECYDEEKLCEYFMAANVTVLPGAIGLTAIHSLTYGTPVITNDNLNKQMPEIEAVATDVNGEFYRDGDVDDLARVIAKWTKNRFPDETIRERCYQVIENFYTPAVQTCVLESVLSTLLAS